MALWELLDRPVVVHRPLIDLGLGLTGALMLSHALYWSRHAKDSARGWIYKTIDDWQRETGLTRTEQETARKRLRATGYWEEKLAGVPARMHFRVDTEKLSEALQNLLTSLRKTGEQACAKPASQFAQNLQTGCAEAANQCAGNPQTKINKITTKTTTETTTETTQVGGAAKKQRTPRKSPGVSAKQPADTSPIVITLGDGRSVELPGGLGYPRDPQTKSFRVWCNYAIAYHKRYHVWPAWNAKQARQCAELVSRVGSDLAPKLAAYYVKDSSDAFVVRTGHQITTLAAQAEQWLARMQGAQLATRKQAELQTKTQGTADAVSQALAMRKARHAQ